MKNTQRGCSVTLNHGGGCVVTNPPPASQSVGDCNLPALNIPCNSGSFTSDCNKMTGS